MCPGRSRGSAGPAQSLSSSSTRAKWSLWPCAVSMLSIQPQADPRCTKAAWAPSALSHPPLHSTSQTPSQAVLGAPGMRATQMETDPNWDLPSWIQLQADTRNNNLDHSPMGTGSTSPHCPGAAETPLTFTSFLPTLLLPLLGNFSCTSN